MIRYLGSVMRGEGAGAVPVPFVRLGSPADLQRLMPRRLRGRGGFLPGVYFIARFDGVTIPVPVPAGEAARLLDQMRRDGMTVPPRIVRVLDGIAREEAHA